jgi:hypothetical protein
MLHNTLRKTGENFSHKFFRMQSWKDFRRMFANTIFKNQYKFQPAMQIGK